MSIYEPANQTNMSMDMVDWRQRREEVEKYCETKRLNSRQRQQLPMAIFEIKTNQTKLSISKILFTFLFFVFSLLFWSLFRKLFQSTLLGGIIPIEKLKISWCFGKNFVKSGLSFNRRISYF